MNWLYWFIVITSIIYWIALIKITKPMWIIDVRKARNYLSRLRAYDEAGE